MHELHWIYAIQRKELANDEHEQKNRAQQLQHAAVQINLI